jgi:hypothetical protein
MRKLMVGKIWIPAFLLAVAMAGCGDSDKSTGGATAPLTPPTVLSVVPLGAATGVCQGAIVTATFSKAMNPATINATTFTLAAGTTAVLGTISIDSTDTVATFAPTNPLALNTQYTATITSGAQDQFGNGLAQTFMWTFTTATTACPGPIAFGPPGCGFGILGASTVTNTGATHVTGDVGVWAGTAITGFPPGTLTGTFSTGPGPGPAMTAQGQLTTAYNNAGTAAAGTFGLGAGNGTLLPPDIGGSTLFPGVYRTTSTSQPTLGITGNLTLDAQGDSTAVWIFQIGSTLKTADTNSQVKLQNGALSQNVFWQIGSSATLGTGTTMAGNLMAQASITLNTGATLNGRALARTGAVSLAGNQVNVPPCP